MDTMYIHRNFKRVKNKLYYSILIMKSIRVGKTVKHETVLNISKLPESVIEAIDFSLKGGNVKSLSGIQDIKQRQGKSYGAIKVVVEIANRIGLMQALGNRREAILTLIMIAGRIICQGSRWYLANFWSKEQSIKEIFKEEIKFSEDDLYDTLKWLSENQREIEKRLWKNKIKGKGKEKVKEIFLYDVTSSYVEGEKNELADYGYNRDEMRGKKQIVVGLMTDKEGDPLTIEVFKGNMNDHKTVIKQLEKIKQDYGMERVVFIGDRGMLKAEQIKEITNEPYRWNYITAITKPQIEKLIKCEVLQIGLFDSELCEIEYEGIRYILRRNPIRAEEIRNNLERRIRFIEDKVEGKNNYLEKHKRAKIDIALKNLNQEIKKRNLGEIINLDKKDGMIIISINQEAKEDYLRLSGCYVIKTDIPKDELSKEIIHNRYKDLTKVEQAFETLKSGLLEIRPIFVRKEASVKGHAFVCLLALKITHYIEQALQSLSLPLKYIIRTLDKIQFRELIFKDNVSIKCLPEIYSDDQTSILQTLKITFPKQL